MTSCASRVKPQHFEHYFRDHDQATKFPSLLSEFSFVAGAVLACLGILTTLLPAEGGLFRVLTNHAWWNGWIFSPGCCSC